MLYSRLQPIMKAAVTDPDHQQRDASDPPPGTHVSRLQLLWDVVIFQFKLVAEGVRDILFSPISIAAAVAGLIAGGDRPDRYFRRVLKLGRRLDHWINLFGRGRHRGTSDELVDGLKQRVFHEAQSNPWLARGGSRLNRTLDGVNDTFRSDAPPDDASVRRGSPPDSTAREP